MVRYKKQDIIRMIQDNDVEFIRFAVSGYFWNIEKYSDYSQSDRKSFKQ